MTLTTQASPKSKEGMPKSKEGMPEDILNAYTVKRFLCNLAFLVYAST